MLRRHHLPEPIWFCRWPCGHWRHFPDCEPSAHRINHPNISSIGFAPTMAGDDRLRRFRRLPQPPFCDLLDSPREVVKVVRFDIISIGSEVFGELLVSR